MTTAIIDLGTNTCNLLIAETGNGKYQILYQGKEAVRLGDGSINQNKISGKAIERTVIALKHHQETIGKYQVGEVKAIATSAVRTAKNQDEFIKRILKETGLAVEVISDNREAELIYKGVILAFGNLPENSLSLDIGGGSNELIISGNEGIKWKGSFPAGMSRVINRFHISDPIKEKEVNNLVSYFEDVHEAAWEMCSQYPGDTLIGCSGAFDTIADIIDQVDPGKKVRVNQKIELEDFREVYRQLLFSTKTERGGMKGMDPVRVELIVPAVILINSLLEKTGITEIFQTDYALREGVLFESFGNNPLI
ncbi:MAG: phosphatase [Chlorobi bacterium]|nr:phosphatase [Chlorobiota bacterium]